MLEDMNNSKYITFHKSYWINVASSLYYKLNTSTTSFPTL